jgi:hypothetical protein
MWDDTPPLLECFPIGIMCPWVALIGRVLNKQNYKKIMGRLGYLSANPHKAEPGELDHLTEAFLLRGEKPRSTSNWLTERQMRSRQEHELQLGDHIERASRTDASWCATLPRLKRVTQPAY